MDGETCGALGEVPSHPVLVGRLGREREPGLGGHGGQLDGGGDGHRLGLGRCHHLYLARGLLSVAHYNDPCMQDNKLFLMTECLES